MIKMVTLLKRKPGMSMEEFIRYYESNHRKIGEKYLRPHAAKYIRRFLHPLPESIVPEAPPEKPYDVVMEIWFENREKMEAAFADLMTEEAQAEIVEDESKLFDRDRIYSSIVEEFESDLG